MNKTKNSLSEKVRKDVCQVLNQNLVNVIDLEYQAKQAHWNIKGMQFRSLHKIFDDVSSIARKYVDEFAERSVQLGSVVKGTIRVAAEQSDLEEYPTDLISAEKHIETIGDRIATVARFTRQAIDKSEKLGDKVTSDIFVDATKDLDELTWMLESYLMDVTSDIRESVEKSRGRSQDISRHVSH